MEIYSMEMTEEQALVFEKKVAECTYKLAPASCYQAFVLESIWQQSIGRDEPRFIYETFTTRLSQMCTSCLEVLFERAQLFVTWRMEELFPDS